MQYLQRPSFFVPSFLKLRAVAADAWRRPIQAGAGTPFWLRSPVFWLALIVLIVNDAWLKQLFPGVVTGKLSDLAGLFCVPAALATMFRLRKRGPAMLLFIGVGAGLLRY